MRLLLHQWFLLSVGIPKERTVAHGPEIRSSVKGRHTWWWFLEARLAGYICLLLISRLLYLLHPLLCLSLLHIRRTTGITCTLLNGQTLQGLIVSLVRILLVSGLISRGSWYLRFLVIWYAQVAQWAAILMKLLKENLPFFVSPNFQAALQGLIAILLGSLVLEQGGRLQGILLWIILRKILSQPLSPSGSSLNLKGMWRWSHVL